MKLTLKLLGVAAVALLATLGFAGTAGAQSVGGYTGATLTIDDLNVNPGEPVTVVGRNFLPNAPVSVIVQSDPVEVGPVITDTNGDFSVTFNAPTDPGTHTVTARDGVNTLVIGFQVIGAGAPGAQGPGSAGAGTSSGAVGTSGNLPYTGNDSSLPLAQIGAGLLAAGAVIALTVRKRQHTAVKVDA